MIDTTLINANNDSGYVYISGGLNDTIKFKPQELWFETDGIYQNKSINSLWNPLDQKSNKIEFKITAADDSTTEGIDTTLLSLSSGYRVLRLACMLSKTMHSPTFMKFSLLTHSRKQRK